VFCENGQLGRDPVNACPGGRAAVSARQLIDSVGGVSVQELGPETLSAGNSRSLSMACSVNFLFFSFGET